MKLRPPEFRRLRVYAIDPSLAARHDTVGINELVLTVPWEQNPRELYGGKRMVGPVGNYLEVIDYDPATGCCYAPIDLNEIAVVAQDGLSPSELNPQFHQQMVYAVAMKTIEHFERALGRPVFWSRNGRRLYADDKGYTPRIRIYPHALREANAFYNPKKKAILFGYFQAPETSKDVPPGTTVFTCLSHDIVAHEVTHALLDGLHHRFAEPTNPDILALHEAFADIVAIFQHFSNAGVLKDQIGRTRGDLEQQNTLGQLAQQFGRATHRGEALRDALGYIGDDGQWYRYLPNPSFLARATEAHERGAVLVAAVFDAFLRMYKARVVDLLRIASNGSGILAPGELHPDLVNRLADEAAKTAGHVLQMCIRALDYCPPVDVTFGDYLRALITADRDLFPVDEHHYRTAVMQSFSLFGIRPSSTRNVSIEALLLPQLRGVKQAVPRSVHADLSDDSDRKKSFLQSQRYCRFVHDWLADKRRSGVLNAIGIVTGQVVPSITNDKGFARFEVHSVRTALRRGSRTSLVPDLVIEITQKRFGYFDRSVQAAVDAGKTKVLPRRDFTLRSGCTLIVDPRARVIRWLARTPHSVDDDDALDRLRDFILDGGTGGMNAFNPPVEPLDRENQFAAVHRD